MTNSFVCSAAFSSISPLEFGKKSSFPSRKFGFWLVVAIQVHVHSPHGERRVVSERFDDYFRVVFPEFSLFWYFEEFRSPASYADWGDCREHSDLVADIQERV